MDYHGTLSIDLLFSTFIFLLIIVTTSHLVLDKYDMVDDSKELSEARLLAENIAGSINLAYAGGDGHIIRIMMPSQINNIKNYRVIVDSSGVLVRLEGRRGLAILVPDKISNSLTSLKSSTVILQPSNAYFIINKKEENGDNWIVIIEE